MCTGGPSYTPQEPAPAAPPASPVKPMASPESPAGGTQANNTATANMRKGRNSMLIPLATGGSGNGLNIPS